MEDSQSKNDKGTQPQFRNKTVAYLRVSTGQQDLNNQKLELHEYAHKHNFKIDEFFEVEVSSRKSTKDRKIDKLLEYLQEGDFLIVTELSRLGRSVGQIIQIIDALIKTNVKFLAVKESIQINGKQDIQTKTMITMFALFAEIERDLISERTKQGLYAAREKGRLIGRPKGTGTSRLDGFKPEIEALLNNGSTKSFIAKRYKTSLNNLYKWMKKHKIPLRPG
ncbi:MAG: recombinase family protein [Nitrospirae bacterium]|nr:recombinase family protein [Nitrospirota bacterium]MBF0535798.1 recombinase family protein [Nitrospirota bacterium]MBF0617661.1 recombinase family protein [Nitrospirota bacterium]